MIRASVPAACERETIGISSPPIASAGRMGMTMGLRLVGRKGLAFLASLFRLGPARRRASSAHHRQGGTRSTTTTTTTTTAPRTWINGDNSSSCSLVAGMRLGEGTTTCNSGPMQRSPRRDNSPGSAIGVACGRPRSAQQQHHQHHQHQTPHHHQQQRTNNDEVDGAMTTTATTTGVARIPSTLSVTAVDVVLTCGRAVASPSHSILTLTPGRTRNIDQDMEALRLSRQDNPFLQVLASKESLIEPSEESESDDAILMSQEFGDTDPLTLAQVHEHLVRSPPPASWSRTAMFHFPHYQQQQHQDGGGTDHHSLQHQQQSSQQQNGRCCRRGSSASPRSMPSHQREAAASAASAVTSAEEQQQQQQQMMHSTKSEGSVEIRDRHSHTFSLLNQAPIRSLSEVRRMHHRSAEDSVQLMSSE